MNDGLIQLQVRMNHNFKDVALLERAITHRSFSADHNERLEFLGDSVLNLAVAHLLFEQLRDLPEGDLSRVRANLVKQETLHQLALKLEIPACLKLGEGELKSGGQRRPSILADALEALIGAVFIDAGYEAAAAVVQRLFGPLIDSADLNRWAKDAKTELQEWLQGRRLPVPVYRIVATRGQAHAQTFEVECVVEALSLSGQGEGRSRRIAEQEAARRLLDQVKAQP